VSFYSDAAADAKELLTEFGQTATWPHDNNDGSLNPATGTTTGGTSTAYSAKGVLLDFQTNRINGTSVLATDSRFLMEVGNKPEVGDIITVNAVEYQVIGAQEVNPAGTPVLYEVQLRV
tara:strand:+ start:2329 stop:2685 length:357 start_codon:yes stop_codon:yes gene_type:complete